MKTILVATRKGGVGKTLLALHLAWYFAEHGRTLLIDMDGQRNASTTLAEHGVQTFAAAQLFHPLLIGAVEHATAPAHDPQLFLMPADPAIDSYMKVEPSPPANADAAERELHAQRLTRESQMLQCFGHNYDQLAPQFDYCVIDSPPADHLCVYAAMLKGNAVVSPIALEQHPIEGVAITVRACQIIKQRYNPALQFVGILPSILDGHSKAQQAHLRALVTNFGQLVLPMAIKKSDSLAATSRSKVPAWRLEGATARIHARALREVLALIHDKAFP